MNVVLTDVVEFQLQTLTPLERDRVAAWMDRLKNWNTDTDLRAETQRLDEFPDLHLVRTSDDMRMIFRVEGETISVLDIVSKSTLLQFA